MLARTHGRTISTGPVNQPANASDNKENGQLFHMDFSIICFVAALFSFIFLFASFVTYVD